MGRSAGRGRFWVAAALSPLLHLGGAAAVFTSLSGPSGLEQPPPDERQAEQPEPPPEDRAVAVGIERSKAATITWIGFETPTEHAATQSDTEQPSLTRDAPSPPPQTPQNPTTEAGESEHNPSESHAEVSAAEPEASERAPEAATEPTERPQPVPEPVIEPAPEPLAIAERPADRLLPAVEMLLRRLMTAAPAPAQSEQDPAKATPEAAMQPPPPRPSETPAEEVSPAPSPVPRDPAAQRSEKESSAVSRTKPIVVRPGRPAAAEGLEIETRHLRLSLYAQVTAGPGRAKVLATFSRAGRVTKVEFVRRTGDKDVDEPILDCVYSWRAKGKALEALDPTNPEAGLVVPFEIEIR